MTARLPAVLALTAALAACGGSSPASPRSSASPAPPAPAGADNSPPGDIPDNQAYVSFAPAGARFSVKVPEGWSQSAHGADVRFTDKLNSIELQWNAAAAPAPAGAKVSTVTRKAGKAQRTTYLTQSQPDPVTGKVRTDAVERYEFTRAGRQVTVTLSGPRGADNVDPWRIVTDSLRWR
jgi:hypothetical protein